MKIMKKKFVKPLIISLICLIIAGTGYFWLSAKKQKSASASGSTEVTMKVSKGSIVSKASGTGNIVSSVRKEIKTLDNGIVDQIFVEEGQDVKAGDKILTFKDETASSQLESARLSMEIQEDKLASLNSDLKDLKVYAPVSGTIDEVNAEEGQELSNGYSLGMIKNAKSIEITALFNSSQVKHINVGDQAQVLLMDSLATVSGKVTKKRTTPTESTDGTVTYEVTITLTNPGGLAAGMEGQVTVSNSQGSYQSAESAELKSVSGQQVSLKNGGTLKKLYVSSGDTVKQGQLLAELENPDLLDDIKSQKLQIEQSRLNLQEQLESIDDTVVYAPISGTISEISVTAGERVAENSTVAVVSDLSALEVVIPVDELDINNVKLGMDASVTVNSVPNTEFKAVVSQIAKEGTVESGVATFDVTLTLKNIEGLKPGMSATGEIIIAQKDDALTVPVEAIQQQGGEKFVLVLKDGKNERVPVKLGIVTDDMVEITEGLSEGDEVAYTVTSTSSANSNSGFPGGGMMGSPPSGGGGGTRSSTTRGSRN